MFGRINWSRWTLLFVIVLTLALSNGTRFGRSQVGGPPSSGLPNLTGKWKLDTGETIDINVEVSYNRPPGHYDKECLSVIKVPSLECGDLSPLC